MNFFHRLYFALLLSIGMCALGFIQPAAAHGEEGTPQLDRVLVGNYLLSVWTYPSYILTGPLHLTATVLDAGSRSPASDYRVLISLIPLEGNGKALTAKEITSPTHQVSVHEFELNLDTPGLYKASIQLQDLSGIVGESDFQIEVHPEYVWLKWILIGLFIHGIVVGVWLVINAPRVWRGSSQAFRHRSIKPKEI